MRRRDMAEVVEAARREIMNLRSHNAQLARQNTEALNEVHAAIAEAQHWRDQANQIEQMLLDERELHNALLATISVDTL